MLKRSVGVMRIKTVVEKVRPEGCDDGCLWDVLGANGDIVISLQVELAENLHPIEAGGNVNHVGEGVVARFGDHV